MSRDRGGRGERVDCAAQVVGVERRVVEVRLAHVGTRRGVDEQSSKLVGEPLEPRLAHLPAITSPYAAGAEV
jgi:hypothetical protein